MLTGRPPPTRRRFIALTYTSAALAVAGCMHARALETVLATDETQRKCLVIGLPYDGVELSQLGAAQVSAPLFAEKYGEYAKVSSLMEVAPAPGMSTVRFSVPIVRDTLKRFKEQLNDDDLAVLLFAGHGATLDGKPYLLIPDTTDDSAAPQYSWVKLEDMLALIGVRPTDDTRKGPTVVFCYACLTSADSYGKYPFVTLDGVILERPAYNQTDFAYVAASNLCVVYSTMPSKESQSAFVQTLATRIVKPIYLDELITEVALDTFTNAGQTPLLTSSLTKRIYLAQRPSDRLEGKPTLALP